VLGGAGGHWAVGLCAANRRESGARTGLHRLARETTLGDAKTPLIPAVNNPAAFGSCGAVRALWAESALLGILGLASGWGVYRNDSHQSRL
jgi:hypothetical protein